MKNNLLKKITTQHNHNIFVALLIEFYVSELITTDKSALWLRQIKSSKM